MLVSQKPRDLPLNALNYLYYGAEKSMHVHVTVPARLLHFFNVCVKEGARLKFINEQSCMPL